MKRTVTIALILATAASLSAQSTPATKAALVTVAEMEKSVQKLTSQLAEIKRTLQNAPACPVPQPCPACPPPVECPVAPVATNCVVSPWGWNGVAGDWSPWTPINATTEEHAQERTIVTPAANGGTCPEASELRRTETRPINITPPQIPIAADTAALNAALSKPGDVRILPNVAYRLNVVPKVDGVRIHGADLDPTNPLPNTMVAENATATYRITPADPYRPTVQVPTGIDGFEIHGVTIAPGQPDTAVVFIGSADEVNPEMQPVDTVLDRNEIVAGVNGGLRGVAVHARKVTITKNRVANFLKQGADSQAIFTANGPGPYLITDNFLQASGENFLSGGASIRSAANVPSDGLISGNIIHKPEEWRQKTGSVKNSVEFKAGRRWLVENNIIIGMWKDAQDGRVFVLTPRNPYNDSPWVVVEDITIRRNIVLKHTDGYFADVMGIDDTLRPTGRTARITFEYNYAESISGIRINRGVAGYFRVRNNTFPLIGRTAWAFEPAPLEQSVRTPCEWTGNVFSAGLYGIQGGGAGSGTTALDAFCEPGWNVSGNVIEQPVRSIWPYQAPNTNVFMGIGPGLLAPKLDENGRYKADASKGWDGSLAGLPR